MRVPVTHELLRRAFGLILALMLALTGQGLAVARTAPDAAGHIVLCTGAGPVMVYVDAEGKPTRAPHYCPDGALGLLDLAVAPDPAPRVLVARPLARQHAAALTRHPRVGATPRARAPPRAV